MRFDGRLLSGLGVLSAVIEAGSFVRAGEALGLTQSAVSRAIARLEQRVGVRMFHRTARSIALTQEGRRFYEAVAPHLTGIEDAAIEAGGASEVVRGRLRVNVDGAIGQFVLTPRIQPFLARHPDLMLDIAVRDRMGDMVAEGFDVCIRFGFPEPSSLTCRLLLETRVLTCASPGYLARNGTPKQPRDLARGHQCILLRDPATGSHFEWEFLRGKKAVPVKVSGQLMVNDTGALLGACLGGQGFAQLLDVYARQFIEAGSLVQVLPEWADEMFPLYAYHHSPKLMSAKVRAFLDYVVSLGARP
ncbi:LysR family transcriptional regulator [Chondromyces apiculatus]|uniref:Transcriptional regulator, LysR family n=1 Tax=Chondromyces apiculatus DSM 436 TaxID=1192034 RepID=A0A017TJC1_9BACT|nr:LysR family transcriptional regulator [Chondromyces apiculatus]EYF08721.1 Transcriptional regulator, LysR family [Chondromyces apiculatus DSM 436]